MPQPAKPSKPHAELPTLEFVDQRAWASWLTGHAASAIGVWLKIAKKGSAGRTVTYVEALEEALCHGWIDGQKAAYDDSYWLQRFTPRTRRSKWSQVNRDKATKLISDQRMKPRGLAEIESAKQDGRWEAAYEPQSRATVPDDFQQALEGSPAAKAFFETLTGAKRYAFLYRVREPKRPETRARRIAQYIAMLAEHRTLH